MAEETTALASTKKEKKRDRRKTSRTRWYEEKDPKERTRRWKEDKKSKKWFTPEWKARKKREWKSEWGREKRQWRELPGDIKKEWKKAKGWGPKIGKVGLVGGAGAWLGHTIGASLMDKAIKKLTEKEKNIPIKEAVKKEIQRRKRRTAEREEIKKAKK